MWLVDTRASSMLLLTLGQVHADLRSLSSHLSVTAEQIAFPAKIVQLAFRFSGTKPSPLLYRSKGNTLVTSVIGDGHLTTKTI